MRFGAVIVIWKTTLVWVELMKSNLFFSLASLIYFERRPLREVTFSAP